MDELENDEAVYAFVRTVPRGKVVTYGQVADSIPGVALTARMVGAAMRHAPADVPWQRVVGAGGLLPIAKLGAEMQDRQRRILLAEGVPFVGEKIDMARCQWIAPERETGSLFDEETAE